MQPYSVKISPEIRSQLKQIAQSENTTSHAVARLAIEVYVNSQKPSTNN